MRKWQGRQRSDWNGARDAASVDDTTSSNEELSALAGGMVLRFSVSGYLSTLLTKKSLGLDSLEEGVRIDEDDLVGCNNEQLPSSVCGVILHRNGGPGVVRVSGKAIEVIQADSKHQDSLWNG